MRRVIDLLLKFATGRLVLFLFILTMVVYAAMLLYTIPMVVASSPEVKLFDLSPSGYTPEEAYTILDSIGPEGRSLYLSVQLPLDFIYPGLFAITYGLLLTWLFKKGLNPSSKAFYWSLVPVFAGLFDYLENIGIIIMVNTFPGLSETVVKITSLFTILKSGFTIVFYVLLVAGIVVLFLGRARKPAEG